MDKYKGSTDGLDYKWIIQQYKLTIVFEEKEKAEKFFAWKSKVKKLFMYCT